MGFFDLFNGKSREKWEMQKEFEREKHKQRLELEREEKELKLGVKKKEAELEKTRLDYQIKLQQQQIGDEFDIYDGDDEEDSDDLTKYMPLISQFLTPPQPIPTASSNSPPTITPSELSFTDEQLEAIYDSLTPKIKKIAKTLPDEQIKEFIRGKYPNITTECLERACARIKR